ncbi:MAG: molybdopterin-dependent oxidoreductase [Deltaproteobacteria bacterium]|nr:molybdopterin-dependent oxidoreductase [Deltaproteobacteria bacterium]
MNRVATRRVRFTRRDALKLLSAGGAVGAGAAVGGAGLVHARERDVANECRLCTMHCGFIGTVRGDDVVAVRGDVDSNTKGFLCQHGLSIPEIVHNRARVRRPLVRAADETAFAEAEWERALDVAAQKLLAVKDKYGPEAIAVQTGWPFVRHPMIHLLHRFCRALGTPNLATVASLCEASARMGKGLVWGANYSPDMAKVRTLAVWGSNPMRSYPPWLSLVAQVKKRGKLIIIDPTRTELADQADEYLQVIPGTDATLALGMLRHVIENDLYDKALVAEHALGFEELRAQALPYTPDVVAKTCGVQPGQVTRVAEWLATVGPPGVWEGLGIEHHGAGVDTVRLVSSLVALCGGAAAQSFHDRKAPDGAPLPLLLPVDQQEPAPPAPDKRPVGFDEYALFCSIHRQAQASVLPRAMLEGKPYPVRALVLFGCNPVVTTPDAAAVKRAYQSLDALVVVDPFLTESGEYADVVLPAATFAEQPPLRFGKPKDQEPSDPPVGAVVEPQARARPDARILAELAERLGIGQYFPWTDIQAAFAVKRGAVVDEWAAERLRAAPERPAGARYPTASGKLELSSTLLPRFGLPSLPVVVEPPAPTAEHPLRLVTGPRQRAYINSQLHKVGAITRLLPEAQCELHPDAARAAGVAHGERVAVVTPMGRAVFRASLTTTVRVDVVVVPHGWDGDSNANLLTSETGLDPISGFPRLRALICRVEKASVTS